MLRKELLEKTFKFDFGLFNSLQDMCFILSDTGEILDMNISGSIKLEIPTDQIGGNLFFSLIENDYIEPVKVTFNNCVKYNRSGNTYGKFRVSNRVLDANIIFTPTYKNWVYGALSLQLKVKLP